jgi:hypothetical protein
MDKKTIDWLLEQIDEFEKKEGKKGAIVHIQNKSLGGYYHAIAENEKVKLKKWHGCELYLARFTKEQLKVEACQQDLRFALKDKSICRKLGRNALVCTAAYSRAHNPPLKCQWQYTRGFPLGNPFSPQVTLCNLNGRYVEISDASVETIDEVLERMEKFERKTGKKPIALKTHNKFFAHYIYKVCAEDKKPELFTWHGFDIFLEYIAKEQLEISACLIDGRHSKWYQDRVYRGMRGTICALQKEYRSNCQFMKLVGHWPLGQKLPYCQKWSRQPGNTGTYLPPPNCLPPRPVEKKKYQK